MTNPQNSADWQQRNRLKNAFNAAPTDTANLLKLARALIPLVRRAGEMELEFYHHGVAVMDKADGSPVTLADQKAEKLISRYLRKIAPGIPIVGEESTAAGEIPDISKGTYFLVDPLDGTKEFIKHNGDFTVNIALMVDNKPVMGIICAPLSGKIYFAGSDEAYELGLDGMEKRLSIRPLPDTGLTVLEGKRPGDAEKTAALLKDSKVEATLDRSSSLKFCAIAAGEADIYPRLGGTSEWDTAAGDAILRAAGGRVVTLDGQSLRYGKADEKFHNPDFIAAGTAEALPLPQRAAGPGPAGRKPA